MSDNIGWFQDRIDNGEWCALSTYKIGLKLTILSQEVHFFVIQWPGRGVVGLVLAPELTASGWIADLVVSLSAGVLNNRLVWASQSVIGSPGNYHDTIVTDETVVWVDSLRLALACWQHMWRNYSFEDWGRIWEKLTSSYSLHKTCMNVGI